MHFHILYVCLCAVPFWSVVLTRSPPKGLEQVRADRGLGVH